MKKEEIVGLVEKLTGKPIRYTDKENNKPCLEHILLERIISKRNLTFNWNEFNEILLICNKDRISKGFFDFFLGSNFNKKSNLTFGELKKGVDYFRKLAMLAYGNFIYAYRTLSKYSLERIKEQLEPFLKDPIKLEKAFKSRPKVLENLYFIPRNRTHYVGYISATSVAVDYESALNLSRFLQSIKDNNTDNLISKLKNYLIKNETRIKEKHTAVNMVTITQKFLKYSSKPTIGQLRIFINRSLADIEKIKIDYEKTREQATLNTDIYLTWDYIDVYMATSMRKKYEYESVYEFGDKLFKTSILKRLNLRYFDPTQSFEKNRIDKGLIEGLMLKRAKCTIYSVQESDTLGKDSELAATLAQGKPVIAYIPEINIKNHANFVKKQSLMFLKDKFDLLNQTFQEPEVQQECIKWSKEQNKPVNDSDSFNDFLIEISDKISNAISKKAWVTIETPWAIESDWINKHKQEFEIICNFVAIADKVFYNKRADQLKYRHPLGIQINLSNGVANGVLVVRNIETCSRLLYSILTNRVKFKLSYDNSLKYWYLEETISKSIYRVVTDDKKITNCFWNFYLLEKD